MALAATNRSNCNDTSALSTYATTTSYTPGNNSLMIATVVNSKASTPETPTVTGNGLTWVQIGSSIAFSTTASPTKRITVFRAMGTGGTNGTVSAAFGGVNQTGCDIIVDEWTGAATDGTNGSGAIVTSTTNSPDTAGTAASVTNSALSDSRNASVGCMGNGDNTAITSSDTLIQQVSYATPTTGAATSWSTTGDLTINFAWTNSARWACVGLEIKDGMTPHRMVARTPAW